MAYVKPTPNDFKAFLPEFLNDDDAWIQSFINQATMWVDQTWLAGDYQPAIIYLAAHWWSLQKSNSSGEDEISSDNNVNQDLIVNTITIEGRTVTFNKRSNSGGNSSGTTFTTESLQRTSYGQMYYMLRRRNVASIGVC